MPGSAPRIQRVAISGVALAAAVVITDRDDGDGEAVRGAHAAMRVNGGRCGKKPDVAAKARGQEGMKSKRAGSALEFMR